VQGIAEPGSALLGHVRIMDTEMSYCQCLSEERGSGRAVSRG